MGIPPNAWFLEENPMVYGWFIAGKLDSNGWWLESIRIIPYHSESQETSIWLVETFFSWFWNFGIGPLKESKLVNSNLFNIPITMVIHPFNHFSHWFETMVKSPKNLKELLELVWNTTRTWPGWLQRFFGPRVIGCLLVLGGAITYHWLVIYSK
jgi:hypothetical protein